MANFQSDVFPPKNLKVWSVIKTVLKTLNNCLSTSVTANEKFCQQENAFYLTINTVKHQSTN